MKKQFQSKAVPRGTRTIWRYLGALFILFTFAIGNVWGADVAFTAGSNTAIAKKVSTSSPLLYMVRGGGGASYTTDYGIQLKTDLIFVFTLDAAADVRINLKSKDTNNAGRDNKFKLYSLNSKKAGFLKILEYSATNNAKLDASYGALKASDSDVTDFSSTSISNANYCSIDNNPAVNSIIGSELTIHTDKNSPADGTFSSVAAGTYVLFCSAAPTTNVCIASITFTSSAATAPAITAPTTDQSASYTVGDVISALEVTATGSPAPTYQWYYNSSASTEGATSLGSGAQTASYTPSSAAESDLYYYCVATNSAGSATSPYFRVTVSTPSTPTHDITYTNTKGADNSANPIEYYEGIGVASFEPLADVTGFHFTGWSPASIADDETTDQTIDAQWVAAYNVTFSAGDGSGTVPSSFQKWEGAKFNLPGQGSMTAPTGKAFDGWKANGAGDKLAADAEYTMGNAAVEFVAQWKAMPTTIFHWRANETTTLDETNGTTTGGTVTLKSTSTSAWSTESAGYNSAVASDMKATTSKELKAGGNAYYLALNLSGSEKFKEGDTIYVTGYNPWIFSTTTDFASFDVADSIFTGTSKTDINTGYEIIKDGIDASTIYARRGRGTGTGIAAIKVIRPAAREIASTVVTLTDLKVNNRSISSDSLDILKTPEAYALTLGDEFVDAPVIKFNEYTVITYVEGLPATKESNKVYTVTATVNGDGKWQAAQEIAGTTYTVTAPKASSAKVSYYDGDTKLGEETVAIDGSPADYADFQDKDYASFVGWYNNSDLAEEHKIADITALTISANTNVYGKWSPAYATSINIEQWVLDNGTGNSALRAELLARHYKYATLNNLDSLNDDPSKANRNYAYLGQKVNKTDSEISFLLKSGSTLKVRFGHLGSTVNVVYGTSEPIALTSANYANEAPTGDKVYEYTATADVIVKFQCTGTSTSVFKQIMIDEEIAAVVLPAIVTLNANGGTYADASVKYTGTPLVIGDATPADEDHVFVGWFDGDDQINAAAYVPTANVTLQAHYANKPYIVTYVGGEGATGSMDPVQAAWGEDYTALACGFEKVNHSFSTWAVVGVAGITEIAAGSSFVMPKGNVTLTAQWVNEALVARIGDNYYESLPEAVAAANDGDVVYLLKDVAAGPGVMIESANAKDITIDFGGYTYIVSTPAVGSTNTKTQGFHFEQGCTITMQNGTIGSTGDEVKMLVQNYCDLTLLNITLDGTDLAGTGRYTLSNNCGNVVIGNGAEIIAQDNGIAFDVCYYASYPSVSVTVMPGASIDGKIEMSMSNNKPNVEENCQLIITGGEFENFSIDHTNIPEANVNAAISAGTFDAPVENLYCAENYVPTDADPVTGKYSVEPKDGVCIVWADATGNNAMTVDATKSMYAATAAASNTKNTSEYGGKTGYKLNSRPANMSVTLTDETFQEGDIVEVFVTTVVNNAGVNDKMRVFDANDVADEHKLAEGTADMVQGANRLVLPATSTASLYLVRGAENAPYDMWNPHVAYIAVYRVIYPTLTAITINGRAGVIDEANKTVAVQIPYEAVLSSLTVVPTIVRNEAHATTPEAVISNEGAWIEGANTYRVMDKDGDYTDYTITLTRDVQKHAVKFYDGETLLETVEVEDGESIDAGDVPADPTKEDYVFQGWAETADGAVVDVTSFTISATKNFYAKWAAETGVIKLLDGEGNVNTTDFITAVTAGTVNFDAADHNCVTFGSTASTAVGASGLNKFIIYNAKTDQTKIKFVLYNTQNGAVTMKLQKLVEGGTEMVEEVINVPSKEEFTTDFYTFNGSANRTMYAFVQNTGIKVLQVKVIDNGTALKQFGEVGYSINFNQGRLFLNSGTDGAYDGLTYNAASNFAPLSSTGLSLTKNKAYRFNVPADATMTVTAANNAKYYITQTEDGEDNETAVAAATSFDLTAGTWYLRVAGSNLGVTNIAFAAPKCAEPVIDNDPESNTNFGQGNLTATVVAHATDGATLAYQWYDADDNEVAGATEATLTTTTEGTYYVIITASKAGYENRSVQSANATLGYRDNTIATLSALTYGTPATAIVLEADKYNYRVTLDEGTTDVPALAATATQAAYGATAVPTDATAFTDYKAVSTVLVTAEDGTTTQTYTVTFVVQHIYAVMEDVTESTTWNWSGSEEAVINDVANKGLIIANYIDGANFEMIEGKENERARRNQNGGVYQGTHLHFNTTVAGKVKFYFRAPSSGENCTITVINNGKAMTAGTRGNSFGWSKEIVVKGDVVIEMVNDKEGGGDTRVQQIVFTELTPDYTRNVSNNIGTLCVDHNVLVGGAMGATFYQIASRNEQYDYKIDFEEVLPGEELKAGEPYIFKSTTGRIDLYYGETVAAQPVAIRGMIGSFANTTLDITEENKSDILYIAQNKLWNCEDLVASDLEVVANRAYIVMSDVPTYDEYHNQQPNNAPIRRCLTISGDQAPAVITGVEDLNVGDQPVKVMIDGQMFILRGEKMYDAQGRLVK